jgi:hypothetical protein
MVRIYADPHPKYGHDLREKEMEKERKRQREGERERCYFVPIRFCGEKQGEPQRMQIKDSRWVLSCRARPCSSNKVVKSIHYSVSDPDPSDPHCFGTPGSGSGSFYHQAKC